MTQSSLAGARTLYRCLAVFPALLLLSTWLLQPAAVDDAAVPRSIAHPHPAAAIAAPVLPAGNLQRDARVELEGLRIQRLAHAQYVRDLHGQFWLHGIGTQLYTAWNTRITLKSMNWYGFEYSPFVPDGLDRAPLDTILRTVRDSGFNSLRLMFANATVRRNPVVWTGLRANPALRGLHSLGVMERIIKRAHHFGLRVILCNSRSESGRGPELQTGLWYTRKFPESEWQADWIALVRRLKNVSGFVGADLRNEPHLTGQVFDEPSYFAHGPLWGAFHETYYHARDWRYAAETMGNSLLAINPRLLIIVEGVQMYLDPWKKTLTGGLWGSNLIGVQYDPIVLSHQSQLVYSVHEYGPKMWMGDWFNASTTYASLAQRWTSLWGYLLTAPRTMQAPIFVGEFGTCDDHFSCVASPKHIPTSGGFWFTAFARYLSANPQVGWAWWALNTNGPFRADQRNLYAFMTPDWRHARPIVLYGLKSLLREPDGL